MTIIKNYTLTILDNEPVYSGRLAQYIGGHDSSPFNIKLFLDHPATLEAINAGDIILLTSSLWDQYHDQAWNDKIIILDEDGSRHENSGILPSIYKYQSAENIYADLINFCLDKGSKRIDCNTDLKKIFQTELIFMPFPSEQNYMLLKQHIEKLSSDKKILYISMEQVPSLALYPNDNDYQHEKKYSKDRKSMKHEYSDDLENTNCGFSELIYYIKQYKDNLGARISSLSQKGSYDYIFPAQLINETYTLDGNDWQNFFDALKNETSYELLILDYGLSMPPVDVLLLCDQISIATAHSDWEEKIHTKFNQILDRIGGNELNNKTSIIELSPAVSVVC